MHRPSFAPAALILTAWVAAPPSLAAQDTAATPHTLSVADYLDLESVGDPRLSPDGSQIVYTRRWVNKVEDRWSTALWIMNADGSKARFLVEGSNPRWSPNGDRILYSAQGEPKGSQVFVRWMDAEGATSQITRVTESPRMPQWSPDGRSIAFVSVVPAEAKWAIDMPRPPQGAKWTEAPRVVERLHYRQDRIGFTEPGFTHLFVVPADGGTPRQVTRGDWNVGTRFDGLVFGGGFDWTPDGTTIVFDGLKDESGDDVYRKSHIYAVDVASGDLRQVTSRPGFWGSPAVSPDGRTVAYSGFDSTTRTWAISDLWTIGLDGSNARNLTDELDRSPSQLTWAPDGSGVYFTAGNEGSINVFIASTRGGAQQVTEGTHVVSLVSLASVGRDLVGVGVRTDADELVDVVRYSLRQPGTITRLTDVNDDLLYGKTVGEVEEIWYTSSSDTRVQGWLVKPPNFDPSQTYPMIMEIHGGPFAMYNVAFNFMFQSFASKGYVVLYTNPRGSTGYGSEFMHGIDHAYPGVDYDDLMAGVDAAIAKGYIDTDRMYVGGCSGGGKLSSWVIGHTDRFAAAAVRCPVTNWMTMAGGSDVPYFSHSFFDKPFWEDPSQWLEHSSLMYVGNVTTPTIIMTGELDMRTPMPQSEDYYAALKMRGVPAKLLRFKGEFHGTGSKPSNYMRTILYMDSWYAQWTKQGKAAATLP
jgi:dipeptidyl aminopeptidase/acylaminoacyl peptidase